jgi:outer membrane protein TolC
MIPIHLVIAMRASVTLFGQVPAAEPPRPISITQAVQITLDRNPLLHIQEKQVEINRGILQQERGRFDIILDGTTGHNRITTPLTPMQTQQAQLAGLTASTQNSNVSEMNGNASRLYRNGISISPSFSLNRNTDNLLDSDGLNTARGGVQVTLPLLRNRGRSVVDGREIAAGINVDASLLDTSQTAAGLIRDTAQAYWQLAAAHQALEVAIGSEERGKVLVENVTYLIEADRMPRSQLNDVNANLAERVTSRFAAEQQVKQAEQGLAVAVGLNYDQVAEFAMPADQQPEPDFVRLPSASPEALRYFILQALARRSDYLAAQKREQSAAALVPAARDQLKPQFDVVLGTGWSGLHDGTRIYNWFMSPVTKVGGIDASVGLHYSVAPRNNAATGRLVQAVSSYEQARLQSADIARRIASDVVVAATGLRNSILRLQQAHLTVTAFQKALEGQRDRLRLGIGSLVDILTIEDRLTSALGNEVSAHLNYSMALAEFRFATGTFIEPNAVSQIVSRDVFYEPPFHNVSPEYLGERENRKP